MQYRPEIDGLRSFAILPVILFHAGYSWIPGGFLGVDVFFVISGYLITSIILKEHRDQRFSLWFFYERRARRILPALFFVLTLSLIAGWFLLSPQGLTHLAQSLLATNLFAANIYFWQHIDYFTGNTNLIPLLHLWSLGIEEQFYVFLPLFFMALWHRSTRALLSLLILLALLSLVSTQLVPPNQSSAAFYLLPTRAWELLAGSLCAFILARRQQPPPKLRANSCSALGLALVVVSVISLNPHIQHPGPWTLVPVLGTVLIILYANPVTYTARLLSYKPFVVIGLLSYSAYLWHQPLFAYTRLYQGQDQLSLPTTWVLIALTFALAGFSWRFVEQPFRNRHFLSQRSIFLLSLGALTISSMLSGLIIFNKGFPQRFNEHSQQILEFESYPYAEIYREGNCFLTEHQDAKAFKEECLLSAQQPALIWGDSHAAALSYGLRQHQPQWAQLNASGCPPLAYTDISWRPHCAEINRFILTHIEKQQPSIIVLEANWGLYELDDLTQRLQNTLELLHSISPKSHIYVLGDLPQWQPSLISLLQQNPMLFKVNNRLLNESFTITKHLERQVRQGTKLGQFISLQELLCEQNRCLAVVANPDQNPVPIAWDYGHPTAEGSLWIAEQLLTQSALKAVND